LWLCKAVSSVSNTSQADWATNLLPIREYACGVARTLGGGTPELVQAAQARLKPHTALRIDAATKL